MNARIDEIRFSQSHRIDSGNQEELKQTLQTYGMIQPIVVRDLGEGIHPQYELIAGYRRLKAAEVLGWTEVPITLMQPKDTLEQFDLSMEENLKRKDFNAFELCELLLQRKRLWEEKNGPIQGGRPSLEEKPYPNGQGFYEESSRIFKKCVQDIHRFLQLQGLDEDLKKAVESEGMYYRTALARQAERKPPTESSKKKKRRGPQIPQPRIDLSWTSPDFQQVFWQLAGVYEALQVIENCVMDLSAIPDDQVLAMMTLSHTIQGWLQTFDRHIQDIMLHRTGLEVPTE